MTNRLRVTMANGQAYHLALSGHKAEVAIFGFNARQPPFSGDFLATDEGASVSRSQVAEIVVVDASGKPVQIETPDFMRQLGWG